MGAKDGMYADGKRSDYINEELQQVTELSKNGKVKTIIRYSSGKITTKSIFEHSVDKEGLKKISETHSNYKTGKTTIVTKYLDINGRVIALITPKKTFQYSYDEFQIRHSNLTKNNENVNAINQ